MSMDDDEEDSRHNTRLPFSNRKLREVRFFLRHLEHEADQLVANEREPFTFYVSAFVSSGFSVTQALQQEAKNAYDDHFETWKAHLLDDDEQLFRYMWDQRTREVHAKDSDSGRRGAELDAGTKDVPVQTVHQNERGRIEIFGPTLAANWIGGSPATIHKRAWLFRIDGEQREVTEACRRYAELLAEIVELVEAAATGQES